MGPFKIPRLACPVRLCPAPADSYLGATCRFVNSEPAESNRCESGRNYRFTSPADSSEPLGRSRHNRLVEYRRGEKATTTMLWSATGRPGRGADNEHFIIINIITLIKSAGRQLTWLSSEPDRGPGEWASELKGDSVQFKFRDV